MKQLISNQKTGYFRECWLRNVHVNLKIRNDPLKTVDGYLWRDWFQTREYDTSKSKTQNNETNMMTHVASNWLINFKLVSWIFWGGWLHYVWQFDNSKCRIQEGDDKDKNFY